MEQQADSRDGMGIAEVKFSFHGGSPWKSMSTTVNYDKYRDCDAAILEAPTSGRAHTPSQPDILSDLPPAIRRTYRKPPRIFRPRATPNTVCQACTPNELTPRCQMEGRAAHRGHRERNS